MRKVIFYAIYIQDKISIMTWIRKLETFPERKSTHYYDFYSQIVQRIFFLFCEQPATRGPFSLFGGKTRKDGKGERKRSRENFKKPPKSSERSMTGGNSILVHFNKIIKPKHLNNNKKKKKKNGATTLSS